MQLPHVTFGGVENKGQGLGGVAQAQMAVGAEAQRTTSIIAEGLSAYGRELVKTQTQQAAIDLDEGLSALENDLNASPYVSRRQLRERLGDDFEGLGELRQQIDGFATDPKTGEVDDDRPLVPTWAVSGAIYERESKRLVEQASKRITTGGWAAEFQANATQDLVRRKAAVNAASMRGLHAFLVESHSQDAMRLARAGNFEGARGVVIRSGALDPAQKLRVIEQVEAIETPVIAQREASQLLEGARREGSPWLDESRALQLVQAIPDSNPRKKLISDLAKEQIALSDAANRRAGEEKANRLVTLLENGASLHGAEVAELRGELLNPANGWANHWLTIERGVRAEQAARRAEARADRTELRQAEQLAQIAAKEATTGFDALPAEERAAATDEQVNLLVAGLDDKRKTLARNAILKARNAARVAVTNGAALTEAQIRTSVVAAAEPFLPAKNRGAAEDKLRAFVTRRLDAWQAVNEGKHPDQAVRDEITAQALLLGDEDGVPGGWFQTAKRAFQVGEGEEWTPFPAEKQPRQAGPRAATSAVTGQPVSTPGFSGVSDAGAIPVAERARLVREYRAKFRTDKAPDEALLLKAYNAELAKLARAGG